MSSKYDLPDSCYYCKVKWADLKKPFDNVEEHKTPISRGGANDESNTVLSCRSCNSRKNMLTENEYFAYIKTGERLYFEQDLYPRLV